MKIEEAIQRLETHKEYISPHGRFTEEAIDMAIEALEKQIPSGIIFNGDEAVCPKCGADAEWKKYCEECGQRLVSDDEG